MDMLWNVYVIRTVIMSYRSALRVFQQKKLDSYSQPSVVKLQHFPCILMVVVSYRYIRFDWCVGSSLAFLFLSRLWLSAGTLSWNTDAFGLLQRVLEHCADELQCEFIVDEILESVLILAQDQYGNYVTQVSVSFVLYHLEICSKQLILPVNVLYA
jgi:hypothetical protein